MVYGADITRPEQRGLLAINKGDLALLFDMDLRRLIGPFEVTTNLYYIDTSFWRNSRWHYVIGLEPASYDVGVIQGRGLLDLVIERGKLSLRDTMSIISYWIHTLILDEAKGILEGFLDNASFKNLESLAREDYSVKNIESSIEWTRKAKPMKNHVCLVVNHKSRIPEYALEASLILDRGFTGKLLPTQNYRLATGVYVYSNRFLDTLLFSEDPLWLSVIEVKTRINNKRDFDHALEQVSYYAYTISRAFNISANRIQPRVVTSYINPSIDLEDTIESKASTYGLRDDLYRIHEVEPSCAEGSIHVKSINH